MDKNHLRRILRDALEEKIPPSEIDLWRSVKASLVAGTAKQQGVNMNTTQPRRIPRATYVTLAVVILLSLTFVTPQGRALAQNVIQFFTRAQSESFQPDGLVTEAGPTASTAMPPAPLMSVAEAEALAGFDLAELPSVPQGFEFLGVRMYGRSVSLEYGVPGGGGNLVLMQSKEGFLQSEWDQAPADAIVSVKVGDAGAEYARGAFVVMAGETSATWNSDAPIFRLRWFKDGIWFELTKYGDVESIEYLDMNGLIALAESLK